MILGNDWKPEWILLFCRRADSEAVQNGCNGDQGNGPLGNPPPEPIRENGLSL